MREDTPADHNAIDDLTRAAFRPYTGAGEPEVDILNKLRAAGALALSLIADDGGAIVGHAAFSPVRIEGQDAAWFGLGPVSVLPERQGRGIGSALIEDGLARLRARGAAGCVVLGDADYYRRFGFMFDHALSWPPAEPGHLGALAFQAAMPRGVVHYAAAFSVA